MKRIFARIAFIAILITGTLSATFAAAQGHHTAIPVKAGQPAPLFATRTIHGKSLRLADLRGRVVLLDFWTTT